MKNSIVTALALTMCATTLGCGVSSRQQLVDAGQKPLDKEALYTLVAGRNLHLTAIDFDAQVVFRDNGSLAALSNGGEKDSGSWDITTDDLLCLDFRTWYYSDLKCYSVFAEKEKSTYIFFTENGARYYTAEPLATIPESLEETSGAKKRSSYLKERQGGVARSIPEETANPDPSPPAEQVSGPEPSKAEMKRILITTAGNCPGCNLAGADFSRADLVGAKLSGASLSGADLRGANLRRADLSGANLHQADLRGANLPGANLRNADLTDADLSGANLIKADLTGAAIKGAIIKDALLEGATGIK